MKQALLNIENIGKTYMADTKRETVALDEVSFSLYSNEITGLIGPNGAGKTTLIRILMGFEIPDNGTISFLNKSTIDLSIRDSIGYQSDLQFRSKSIELYSYMKIHSDLYGIEEADSVINELLNSFGLSGAKYKRLSELSKGMRQKLELAATFLNKPKLVILDEPTAALDPPSVFELRDYLYKYKMSGGTVLFSSHHLTEVEKICDRVIFIDNGKILRDYYVSETEPGFLEEAFRKYESERKFL
jgi:ABC-type multidrug transport system ATPase subunit